MSVEDIYHILIMKMSTIRCTDQKPSSGTSRHHVRKVFIGATCSSKVHVVKPSQALVALKLLHLFLDPFILEAGSGTGTHSDASTPLALAAQPNPNHSSVRPDRIGSTVSFPAR